MSFKKYNAELLRLALLQGDHLTGHDTRTNTYIAIYYKESRGYYGIDRLGNHWEGWLDEGELEDPDIEWHIVQKHR